MRACGRTTIIAVMMCILVLISAAVPPRAAAAMRPTDAIRVHLEGYLVAKGAGKWLINDATILVDSLSIIIEKRGRAEVGAWVVVWGIQSATGSIYGELIQVDRPAGQSSPVRQFSGVVSKYVKPWWVINGLPVQETENTEIKGAPGPGWLVWVVAEDLGTSLRGLVIEAIAQTPESVPVEFTGTLETYGPDGGQVDDHAFILANGAKIIGEPAVGLKVEIQALQASPDLLVVLLLSVIMTPTAWTQAHGSLPGRGADPASANHLDQFAPLVLPLAQAQQDTTIVWSTPELVAGGLTNAAQPVLATTADGTTHALWESGGQVFWAFRPPLQGWSRGERIADGREPALAVDGSGRLHALFTNPFRDNDEIYHVLYTAGAWTLPVNISLTTGQSKAPALAITPNGELHATWMDHSPGYWTIYAAHWSGDFWSNRPVPYARGESPAIAIAPTGIVFLAWEDHVPTVDNPTGFTDIFESEWQVDRWSLPVNVSDNTAVNAHEVSIATTTDGLVHLVWVESGRTLRYDFGQGRYWPLPWTIAEAPILARGPRLAVADGDILHIAWDEGDILKTTSAASMSAVWPEPAVVSAPQRMLKDVGLTVTAGNEVILSWVQVLQPDSAIYESRCNRLLTYRTWMPLLLFYP